MSRRLHLIGEDIDGRPWTTWVGYDDPAGAEPIIDAVMDLSNAGLSGALWSGADPIDLAGVPTPATGGRFATVDDLLVLEFPTYQGVTRVTIPGPKESCFTAAGWRANLEDPNLQALCVELQDRGRTPDGRAWGPVVRGWRGYGVPGRWWDARAGWPITCNQIRESGTLGIWTVDLEDVGGYRASWHLVTEDGGASLRDGVLGLLQAVTCCEVIHQEKAAEALPVAKKRAAVAGPYDARDRIMISLELWGGGMELLEIPAPRADALKADTWKVDFDRGPHVPAFDQTAKDWIRQWEPGPGADADLATFKVWWGWRRPRIVWPADRDRGEPREDRKATD